jgi:hypothetical protein
LCDAAGDQVSLAIGMTGQATDLLFAGRSREGARLVSEQMGLLESIGDASLTMGLAFIAFCTWFDSGEFVELLRWSQTVVDLAEGDPVKGAGFGLGSPLAAAHAWRSFSRSWLGRSGWRRDLDDALAMARESTPETLAGITAWTYGSAMQFGALRPDDAAVRTIEEALRIAAASSSNVPVALVKYTLGIALLGRDDAADRDRGLDMMGAARELFIPAQAVFLLPVADLWTAREWASRGDRDTAIPAIRNAVGELREAGRHGYGVWGTGILAETLIERGTENDLTEAQQAIDWLANLPAADDSAMIGIMLLRLRTLLTRARGDDTAHLDLLGQYRAMAKSLGYEGHIDWAEALE